MGKSVSPCLAAFADLKKKRAVSFAVFAVSEGHGLVTLERLAGAADTYDDFLDALPPADCRFAVYGRGLHSFTLQLKLSAFCGYRGGMEAVCRGCLPVSGGGRGCQGCACVSETAQVELRSGRVSAPGVRLSVPQR